MPYYFCMTFMFHVSNTLYDDSNKTSDILTKLSPNIKFDGEYEVALFYCIQKNTYDTLRTDRTYDVKVRPND